MITTTTSITTTASSIPSSTLPIDALDHAVTVGNARVQSTQDQMLTSMFKLIFNMGDKSRLLKDEQVRLHSEIALQKRSIELLEAQHQEQWTAHIETTRARMRVILSKISEIIKSIETKEQSDRSFIDGPTRSSPGSGPILPIVESIWRLYFYQICQCLPFFKRWFNLLEAKCLKPPEARCFRQSNALKQDFEMAANFEVLAVSAQMVDFPQLAPFVQEILTQEKEVSAKKQELAFLKQLSESKKKDYQDSIEALNFISQKYTFKPCLEYANNLKKIIELYIATEKKICEDRHGKPIADHFWVDHTGIVEANRIKGMICLILPDIEKAIEWTHNEIEIDIDIEL